MWVRAPLRGFFQGYCGDSFRAHVVKSFGGLAFQVYDCRVVLSWDIGKISDVGNGVQLVRALRSSRIPQFKAHRGDWIQNQRSYKSASKLSSKVHQGELETTEQRVGGALELR